MLLLPAALKRLALVWRLVRDPRVPFLLRILPALALIYVLSPLDLLRGRGMLAWADDLLVLLLACWLLLWLAPKAVVRERRGSHGQTSEHPPEQPTRKVVEGHSRRLD
ncbi:MAG: hypothetical protein FJ316_01220 [SAR202 cluster bacterium]|nr:hypothetical protein [SAR202 cluster bacterium]